MKISTKVFIFSLFMLAMPKPSFGQDKQEIKAFKSDINMATIDRVEITEKYMENLSSTFIQTKDELEKQKTKNAQLENEIKELKESMKVFTSEQLKKIETRLTALEDKTSKHDFDKLQTEHDQLLADFKTLSKDYTQAKMMLEQIKLLLMTDYTSRFNPKGASDNKLKGIVEEINKIQLPKAATPTPSVTPTVTPTPALKASPTPGATATSTPAASASPEQENFIEKYPLPARQSFCRQPENLRKYQKECLPYL